MLIVKLCYDMYVRCFSNKPMLLERKWFQMTLESIVVVVLIALVAMMVLPIRLFKSAGYRQRLTLLELLATRSKRYKRDMAKAEDQRGQAERARIRAEGSLARLERRRQSNAPDVVLSNGQQNTQLK